ncbi:phage tail-collar fiber domain-containing protein [Escherichia coli]|uniref:phage tail-collar fiber domain-containing protein n=1 Tax=Escherichia coli TaxID=562 RepID=UPI00111B48CD|nr:phage tail protein [Escherichia coli]
MSTKFKTVITTAGAAKLAAATVPGGKKVTLSAMAVGDGNGKLPVPDAGQTKLVHEVWRHALNKVSVDNKNKNYIVAELVVPPEVGGFWMRELGLYDDAGTLIAVSNMAESYKPELAEGSGRAQTCRMVIIVSNVASVELSIDASTVMATQDYVDDKIAEHEQSRRHPDATLTEKGFTQLSSATNSTSEKLAATPKAVKAAYDNAEKRMQKDQNGGDIPDKGAFLDNVGVTSLTFMKNNGEMPLDADLNTFGPVKAYLGIWSKATSTNATLEKNFPEDNAVGVLEVFAAGNFAGTQRFTTRDGNVYIRRLANKWNGSDGPWGIWRHTQSATGRSMHVWRSTVSKANYRFFMVRVSGNPGSRTITTRRVPIIDEAQTWGAKQTFSAGLSGELFGNAATATKLKTARKINNVSFDGTSDINLTPEDIGALPITGGTLTGGLTAAGEIISKSANGLRIAYGNYGFFIRNDGSSTYLMLTNSGDSLGTWNSLRPLTINNASGAVSIGNSLTVNGDIGTNAWVYANRFAINSSTGMWINMRDQNVIFGRNAVSTDGAQALLRQDHADRKFMIGGLGNKQFGIYMINNSRTANGTDGQAYMDNNGNWLCGAQVIPGNYGNFDSRYVRDVRLGTRVVQTMQKGVMYEKSGHVITGLGIVGEVDGDDPAVFRPVQKYINGTWYNVSQV